MPPHRTAPYCAALLALAALACDERAIQSLDVFSLTVSPPIASVAPGNTVQLVSIALDTNLVPFIGVPTTWTTSDAGIATVTTGGLVQGVAIGTATITATADGLTATAIVSVEPLPAIALAPDTVAVNAVANGPNPAPATAAVTNGGGTNLTGLAIDSITYGAGASSWLGAALDQTAAPATLTLSFTTSSLPIGNYTAVVSLSAPQATNSPQFVTVTLAVAVGAASQIAANGGDGQTAPVNTAVATAPSVLVRDAYNNPVPGVGVTFAAATGGGSVTGGSATTNASGIAQPTSWTLGTVAGANTLTATAPGLSGSPVTFSATATAGGATQIAVQAGQGQSATVNTTVATAPAVLVRDAFNNPVSGVAVTFAVTGGGGGVTGGAAVTGANGVAAVGSWTLGTAAGANSLTATSAGLTGSPVTFNATGTAGAATQMALNAGNGQSATVNTTVATAPSVLVRDAFNNPVAGTGVTFAVFAGGGGVTGGAATSNASGIATVGSWTLGTAAGGNTLRATSSGLTGSPVDFTATGTAGAATQIAVNDGDNQSAQVATAVPTAPSVFVGDAFNNPVAGTNVTFGVSGGGGSVTGAIASSNASGVARVGSWTLGVAAGTNTLGANAVGLAGSPVTFTATGFAGAATTLIYDAGDAQTDSAGATLAVAYRVRATDGVNGVAGVPVSWAVTGGGGSISPPSSNTDVNGYATAVRTLGTTAGAQSATASVGGLTGSPITFNATATPATATLLALNAGDGQSATVNTAVATDPSVIVTDQFGNGVAGASVTFTLTGGGGTIAPASPAIVATNGSGVATLTSWTLGTAAGTSNNTLSATAAGLSGSPLPFSATATPDVADAGQSSVAASSPIVACNTSCSTGGGTQSAITITVRDQYANPIPGASVTWSATGTGNSASNTGGTTDGFGQFTAGRLSSTAAATKTVSALGGALPITQTANVTVGPAAASLAASTVVASDNSITACLSSCTPGGPNTASTITATVTDAFGNTIDGAIVAFSSTGSANAFAASATDTTSGGGIASRNFSSTAAEAKTVSGAISGVGTVTQTAGVTVIAAAASQVVMVTQPANATSNQYFVTQPSVRLRDPFGNNVSQAGVSIRALISSGTGTIKGDSLHVTNASGITTYDSLRIEGYYTGFGNHALQFTSGGLSSVTSNTFDVITSFVYNLQNGVFCSGGCPATDYNSCEWCHAYLFQHTDLVNVASSCGGIPYVTPGDTVNSFLFHKVKGVQGCGSSMPPSGPQTDFVNTIRRWILQGAPNN